jgi:hypothetical protein
MAENWRRVIAALANPSTRSVFAEIVARDAGEVSVTQREHAIEALASAGMIIADGDDEFVASTSLYKELLDADPVATKQGVQRFLRDGRIDQFPAKPAERLQLLAWAVSQAVPADATLSEAEVNERLAELVDDVAVLRRYLVDAGLLARDADGRAYRRAVV